jgi:hypothetical protein
MDPIGTTAEVHLRPLELLEILEIWQLVKNKTPINLFICETIRQCYLGTIRLLRRSDGLELTPKSISNGLATANRKKERSSRLGISYAITVQSPSRSPASVNLAGRGATPSRFPGCPRPVAGLPARLPFPPPVHTPLQQTLLDSLCNQRRSEPACLLLRYVL